MCLLIYKPTGITIPDEVFRNAYTNNKDGIGFSYMGSESMIIRKGFMGLESFLSVYREVESLECLIHFRIATSGTIDKNNCHPFRITAKMVFAHNGIFSYRTTPTQSDTHCLSIDLRKIGFNENTVYKRAYQSILESIVESSGSKVALQWIDKHSGKSRVWIVNEKKGIWEHGVWYSNESFKKQEPRKPWFYNSAWNEKTYIPIPRKKENGFHCPVCGEFNPYEFNREWVCEYCLSDYVDVQRMKDWNKEEKR